MSGIMDNDLKWEIRESGLNSTLVCYIQLCINTFGKGINPSPSPAMG